MPQDITPNGAVTVETGGRQFELRFSTNDLCDVEDLLGGSVQKVFAPEEAGITTIRTLFYVGARHDANFRSPEDAGKALDLKDIEQVSEAIGEAVEAALPESMAGGEEVGKAT